MTKNVNNTVIKKKIFLVHVRVGSPIHLNLMCLPNSAKLLDVSCRRQHEIHVFPPSTIAPPLATTSWSDGDYYYYYYHQNAGDYGLPPQDGGSGRAGGVDRRYGHGYRKPWRFTRA